MSSAYKSLCQICDVLDVFFSWREGQQEGVLGKHGNMIDVNVFLSSYCHSTEGVQTAWRLCMGWRDACCLCPTLGIPSVVLAQPIRPHSSWRNVGSL